MRSAAGLVIAALIGWGAARAAPPPAPLGLDVEGTQFALTANSGWKVGGGNARTVQMIREGAPDSRSEFERQDLAFIWAKTCVASRQSLVFTRTYFLPGPAKTFAAEFIDTTGTGGASDWAVSATRVFINGTLAFSFKGAGGRIETTEKRLPALFKFGLNEIEIHVEKRAQSGNLGRCSYGDPAKPFGIYFALHGKFEADLWLSKGEEINVWQRGRGEVQALEFNVAPKNIGPSGAYTGTLSVSASGLADFTMISPPRSTGPEIRDCKTTLAPLFRVDCTLFRLPKGSTTALNFTVAGRLPPTYDVVTVIGYARTWSSTYDPNGSTNEKRKLFHICSPTSTNLSCP